MSRIAEALVLDTDEERIAWFSSLSEDERAEVVKDAREIADKMIAALTPIGEVMREFCVRAGELEMFCKRHLQTTSTEPIDR